MGKYSGFLISLAFLGCLPAMAQAPTVIAEEPSAELSEPTASATISPWSYGLYAGLGGIFPTGSLADSFSGACAFTFGIQGGWHRVRLDASLNYANPTLYKPELVESKYEGQGFHANVKNANYLGVGFGAGYAIFDGKRFSVVPYAGGRWTSYSWTARPMSEDMTGVFIPYGPQQRMKLEDFDVTFGIHLEWHFLSTETEVPLIDSPGEHYVSSLRLTPYATRAVYSQASSGCNGWQIGFTVCYSGLARTLGY